MNAVMTIHERVLSMLLLTSALALGACTDEGPEDLPPPRPPATETFTCRATISPGQFDYVVNGDVLEATGRVMSARLRHISAASYHAYI